MDDQRFQQQSVPPKEQPQQQMGYQPPQQTGYQPYQGAQQPVGYPGQAPKPEFKKGMSIAALVCGILGIVGGFIPVVMYFTLVLAILGIIFGVKGQKSAKAVGVTSGLATAGLICGIVGASFSAVGVICALACVGAAGSAVGGLSSLL